MDRAPYAQPLVYDELVAEPCRASYARIFVGTRDGRIEAGTVRAKPGHLDSVSLVDALPLSFHLHAAYRLDPTHCSGRHPDSSVRGQTRLAAAAAGHLAYFPAGLHAHHHHLHGYSLDYSSLEPSFIRKRNERERHRVRCVNEGYARLREHLPPELEDKRLSKVETLRAAIDYIKHLQGLLDRGGVVSETTVALRDARGGGGGRAAASAPQRTECNSDGESKASLSDCGENAY